MTARAILLTAACTCPVVGAPGDLLPSFAPELRAEGTPAMVSVTEDGRILAGGGFSAVDGAEMSDRVLLGPDGGVAGEPVPEWLEEGPRFLSPLTGIYGPGQWISLELGGVGPTNRWFPLEAGGWLIPGKNGAWSRSADGSPFFTDLEEGARAWPLFERAGRVWVLRTKDGESGILEARNAMSGEIDPAFSQADDWPGEALDAAPGPDGSVWVLGGRQPAAFPSLSFQDDDGALSVYRVDASGVLDASVPARELPAFRRAGLSPSEGGGFTLSLGPDRRAWRYWPSPEKEVHRIEWYSGSGAPLRDENLAIPVLSPLAWAMDGEGNFLAPGADGRLRKILSDGTEDTTFHSPGRAVSVHALPDGKWLVDGKRRLLADGSPDETWSVPGFEQPASVSDLRRFPDGRVLAVGDFFSVNGEERKSLAVFRADGSLDGDFSPDERLGTVESAAISGGRVFAITREPVVWGDLRSRLVKLAEDGSLDESFQPGHTTPPWFSPDLATAIAVHAHVDGGVLVETFSGREVMTWRLTRMKADGSVDAGFAQVEAWQGLRRPVVLADGRFAVGRAIHAADGKLLGEVGGSLPLSALCEWQGGVLFLEGFHGGQAFSRSRLRLWRGGAWVPVAAPPVTGAATATEGGDGSLYLCAAFPGEEGAALRRIGWIGRTDATFGAAPLNLRPRREDRAWRVSGEDGFDAYDPGAHELEAKPAAMLWHPAGQRLWVGGSFNRAAGEDRDGLAWLVGAGAESGGGRPDAYTAWEAGFGLPEGSADGDADGDGVPNGIEFALGTDPWTKSAGPAFEMNDGQLVLRYALSAEASGSQPVVEASTDLASWTPLTVLPASRKVTNGTGDAKEVVVTLPPEASKRRFVRLRVDLP